MGRIENERKVKRHKEPVGKTLARLATGVRLHAED
jgi:hypothetical protein